MVCGQVLMTTTVLWAYLRMVTDDHKMFFRTVFGVWNHASELLRHHLYSPGQTARLFSGARPTHASAPRICAAFSRTEHAHLQIHLSVCLSLIRPPSVT